MHYSLAKVETGTEDSVEPDDIYETTTAATTTIDKGVDLLPSWKECGVQYENRILGGDLLDLDEFPWMALLIYNKNIR